MASKDNNLAPVVVISRTAEGLYVIQVVGEGGSASVTNLAQVKAQLAAIYAS